MEQIQREIDKGAKVHCPNCDLWFPESETCAIICCDDPLENGSRDSN